MTTAPKKPTVAIVGGGLGGIAMGIQLAHGGYDFTIFDRGDDFGGTWRKNTYPGAACDVPSHFYSYSFALNPRWSKTFADQPEILAYIEKVAAHYGLSEHLVPRTRVTMLRWSDTDLRWTLTTEDGQSREFDIVVSQTKSNHVLMLSAFDAAAALEAHQTSDHYKAYMAATKSIISMSTALPLSSVAVLTK